MEKISEEVKNINTKVSGQHTHYSGIYPDVDN